MTPCFQPAPLLRSPHLQTVLGSRGRGWWVRRRAQGLLSASERELLKVNDGIRLEAWLSSRPDPAPTIILIHGWLGHAESSYLRSAGAELWNAGFNVIRLNLRDHGDTANLNEEMFNSARLEEVINAVDLLARRAAGPVGLAGFSLGGNFALRVCRALGLETLAICPVVDPHATMRSIDSGAAIYRMFFLAKWRRALRAKATAFPGRYQFDEAYRLTTVSALTDLFVSQHTSFPSTSAYLNAYSLTGDALVGTRATILTSADDPVIPVEGFDSLPGSVTVTTTRYGGHCAFVEHPARPGWADRQLVRHFQERLG